MIKEFPYGNTFLELDIPSNQFKGELVSRLHSYESGKTEVELVEDSMKTPIGSKTLKELAKAKRRVTVIASDHTRPVPSKVIMPLILREIRKGNPKAEITILIATGCHRETTKEELIGKFGSEIYKKEKIVIHDCDKDAMVRIGTLPSGGACIVNKLAIDTDLLVAEGFIEPHFFAGFSGGRKSVLPGVCSRETVMANHCSEFIDDKKATTGILENNPIHEDMIWAAKKAKLAFIVNVVVNMEKKIVFSVAGDVDKAHKIGCSKVLELFKVKANVADIVITTNGGYPLDQNIYQAVKGMTAAEASVRQDGVIIMMAKSNDGHGGEDFYHQMADEKDINKTLQMFRNSNRNQTRPDQWQSQILIRVLNKAKVIYISDAPDEMIKNFHMIPSHDLREALQKAEEILKNQNASIVTIPDGVSVIVQ
ncbi:MAG: nickel-dependent lactate racemase [Sphaerochaetaceae bacterium]